MLNLAGQGKKIRVVNDQICSQTLTDDLAAATLRLLPTNAFGLYHLTSAGECTWHEFARTIFELAGVTADLHGISSAEFGAAARRPEYSVLANEAYAGLDLPPIQHWKSALEAYLSRPRPTPRVRRTYPLPREDQSSAEYNENSSRGA